MIDSNKDIKKQSNKSDKVSKKVGGMQDFNNYFDKNKEKILEVTAKNTLKNKEKIPVISRDDEWREEKEWDEVYQCLKKKK